MSDLTATISAQELLDQLVAANVRIAKLEEEAESQFRKLWERGVELDNARAALADWKKHRCIVGYTATTRVRSGHNQYEDGDVLYRRTLDDLREEAEKAAKDAKPLRTSKLDAKPIARPIFVGGR